MTSIDVEPECCDNPAHKPPKPCDAGLTSHVWRLNIEGGGMSLGTDECSQCHAVVQEFDSEYMAADFEVKISFETDCPGSGYNYSAGFSHPTGCDCNHWLEVNPVADSAPSESKQ